MNKKLVKVRNVAFRVIFLMLLYIIAVLGFSRIMNQVAPDAAEEMADSTFPLVFMERDGVTFNALHGYAQQMDPSYIHDSVTPLSENREIGLQIETFSSTVDSVSYQVMEKDGSAQLENTQVIKLDQKDGMLTATLQLQNKMLMNKEYMLEIRVKTGGRDIYYYTHVLLADGLHTDEYLNFVSGFYDKTVNKTDLNSVAASVEPDETTDEEQTLARMDIHDSVNQLTWDDLNPQIYYKPTPCIKEINTTTASVVNEYRIAAVNEDGGTEIYNVTEYYRLRFTDSRVFLLNFERETSEVFNPDNGVLKNGKGVMLGITSQDVEFTTDERHKMIAFVQENDLWTYEISSSNMTHIFGFPQRENMDARDFYNRNSIRILRVSGDGDVWFTVSGYMNRGVHEGQNGVALYYYEAGTATVDEKTFIASYENADQLRLDVEELAYVTDKGKTFYVLLEEKLYKIDLAADTSEILAEGIHSGCCAGSKSGRYFSYLVEGEEYASSTLIQMDFESGASQTFKAKDGEKLSPVCYMGEDLIYGTARDTDIADGSLEFGYFPMYMLKIVDGEGNELKTYKPDGYYVTEATASDKMINLTRVARDGNSFKEAPGDQIVNTDTSSSVSIGIGTTSSSRKQTVVLLRTGGSVSDKQINAIYSKVIAYDNPPVIQIPANQDREELFEIYSGARLYDRVHKANIAVTVADAQLGYAMDTDQNYIWVRGDQAGTADIKLSHVPEAMRTDKIDPAELETKLEKTVLDLSGCTLSQVLYYVSHDTPVLAMTKDGPVVIVGYDEYNTHLIGPDDEEWYYYGINDSETLFAEAGNIFYSYIK